MKHVSKVIIILLLSTILIVATTTFQGAATDLEWGISKGNKFAWELKTLIIGNDYDDCYDDDYTWFEEEVEEGSKMEIEFISDLPATDDELEYAEAEDIYKAKVDGKEIDLESIEDEEYNLGPALFLPTGMGSYDLKDFVDYYADEWQDLIDDYNFNGDVDLTSSGGKVILEIDINSAEIGNSNRDWDIKMTYEEKTGVLFLFQHDLENAIELKMERIGTGDNGIGVPLVPVILALVIPSVLSLRFRKKS